MHFLSRNFLVALAIFIITDLRSSRYSNYSTNAEMLMNTDSIDLGGYRDNFNALTIALVLYRKDDIDASFSLLTRLKLHIQKTADIKSSIHLMPAIDLYLSRINSKVTSPSTKKKSWLKRHFNWTLKQAAGFAIQIVVYLLVVNIVVGWKLTTILS